MKFTSTALAALAAIVPAVQGVTWKHADTIIGNDFYNKFNFFNGNDPTNGYVNYRSKEESVQKNLTYIKDDDSLVLRVDTTPYAPKGRGSVRLQSKALYEDSVYMCVSANQPQGESFPHWLRHMAGVLDSDVGPYELAFWW